MAICTFLYMISSMEEYIRYIKQLMSQVSICLEEFFIRIVIFETDALPPFLIIFNKYRMDKIINSNFG